MNKLILQPFWNKTNANYSLSHWERTPTDIALSHGMEMQIFILKDIVKHLLNFNNTGWYKVCVDFLITFLAIVGCTAISRRCNIPY